MSTRNDAELCIIEKSFKETGSEDVAYCTNQLAATIDDDATTEESEHASVTTHDGSDFYERV